jgi:hypothetical protein
MPFVIERMSESKLVVRWEYASLANNIDSALDIQARFLETQIQP